MSMAIRSLHSKVPTIFRYYCRRLVSSVAATSDERVTNPKSGAHVEPCNNLKVDTHVETLREADHAAPKDVGLPFKLDIDDTLHPGSWVMNSRLEKSPVSKEVLVGNIDHKRYHNLCGMEDGDDNASCDHNVEEIIKTIAFIKSQSTSQVSNVVVKMTAICPTRLLKRVGDLIKWKYLDGNTLTIEENRDLELGFQRLIKICKNSLEANMTLLIEPEDASIQPAIDYFMYNAALNNNRYDSPLSLSTYAAYLKDARERPVMVKKAADEAGAPMGYKQIRAACMSTQIFNGSGCYRVRGTQNIESGKHAAAKVSSLGIMNDNENLQSFPLQILINDL